MTGRARGGLKATALRLLLLLTGTIWSTACVNNSVCAAQQNQTHFHYADVERRRELAGQRHVHARAKTDPENQRCPPPSNNLI